MTLMMDAAFLGLLYSPPAYADADVNAYISAVELADGGGAGSTPVQLEQGIRDAINIFITGCKADGIWSALTQCSLFMGARTLAGILVPLRGGANNAFNFVAGDYNRRRLKGDASTKYITTPFVFRQYVQVNTADRQKHWSCYVETADTTTFSAYMGFDENTWWYPLKNSSTNILLAVNGYPDTTPALMNRPFSGNEVGFLGGSRSSDTAVSIVTPLAGLENPNYQYVLGTPPDFIGPTADRTPSVFATWFNGSPNVVPTDAGLAWYSFGDNINLTQLRDRVATLRSSIYAIVP